MEYPSVPILETILSEKYTGFRLDKALAELFPDFSRSFLQAAIKNGHILVNGQVSRPRDTVVGGERVVFDTDRALDAHIDESRPENIALDIIYEDDDILLVNKPVGMVVHPAAGHPGCTLVNALLYRRPDLKRLPRAGIIHRLDKDTSGLLLVAGNHATYQRLVGQMQRREILREYLCLVCGQVIAGGTIEAAIGRDPRDRKRMAVTPGGKPSITHYRVEQRFKAHTLLRVRLETGRTHQIRVHLAHIHYPVFGDPLYGGRFKKPAGAGDELLSVLINFKRQALHATKLELVHPVSSDLCVWQSDMPADMQKLIDLLS